MKRSILLAVTCVIYTASIAAHADTVAETKRERRGSAVEKDLGKEGVKEGVKASKDPKGAAVVSGKHGQFPMTAAEFRQKHEARLAKARAKMEDRIKDKKIAPEKAKLMRMRFDTISGKVNAAIAKAAADGAVTKDEAKEIHGVARQARREVRASKPESLPRPERAKAAPKL